MATKNSGGDLMDAVFDSIGHFDRVPRAAQVYSYFYPFEVVNGIIGEVKEEMVVEIPGGVFLPLENVRFLKEDEKNDPKFAKKLASCSDIYVAVAFGTAHIGIGHASIGGVTKGLKTSVVGSFMQEEPFYRLIGAMNPEKPYALSLEKGDLHLPGGGLTSTYKASRVVNKVDAVGVGQNEEKINVLVPIASHLQHVNHIKIKRPIVPPIMFTDDDLDGVQLPHNDPLVIALKVDDQLVDRFFVDQGSSVDIMYLNCFEKLDPKLKNLKPTMTVLSGFNEQEERPRGVVTLPIHAGSVTVQVDFLVVNVTSQCNAILGRPFLHKMMAVGSSYHQKLKFPTKKGIEEIRGNQVVSRMCSMVAVTPKIVPVPYGCMGSDSGPMAVLDFDKYVEEGETDANELEDVGGMGVTTAVAKVGASLELLEEKSLPEVPALDDA